MSDREQPLVGPSGPREYIASLDNDTLLNRGESAFKDLAEASEVEPNSEWHESCFAASLLFAEEINRRGLQRNPVSADAAKQEDGE